jgi:hypothetical protein
MIQKNIEYIYQKIYAPTKERTDKKSKEDRFTKTRCWNINDKTFNDINSWNNEAVFLLRDSAWQFTPKLHGQNIRIYWDGYSVSCNGRTNNSQLDADTLKALNGFTEERFEEKFKDKKVLLIGELVGTKINKNTENLDKKYFVGIDVFVADTLLEKENAKEIFNFFGYSSVLNWRNTNIPNTTLNNFMRSFVNEKAFTNYEGFVATPVGNFYDRLKKRIIVKIKNYDYSIGWKETDIHKAEKDNNIVNEIVNCKLKRKLTNV